VQDLAVAAHQWALQDKEKGYVRFMPKKSP